MNDWLNSLASESILEDAALAWLESIGYTVKHGPEIVSCVPWMKDAKRTTWDRV